MPESSALLVSSCSALQSGGSSGSSRIKPSAPRSTPSGTPTPPISRLPAASSASPASSRNSADQSPSSASRSAWLVTSSFASNGWPSRSMRAPLASSVGASLNFGQLHARQRLVGGVHHERTERAHHVHHAWRQNLQVGQVLADAVDAQDATDDGRFDRRQLGDRRVIGQAGQLARGGQRLAQAAQLVDQLVLQRLLTGPNSTLPDRVDLLFGELATFGDALQKHVVELPDLALQLDLLFGAEGAEDRLGVGARRGFVGLDADAQLA